MVPTTGGVSEKEKLTMLSFYQLTKTGLLTTAALLRLIKAKRKHKDNLCFILKFAADHYGNKTAVTGNNQSYSFKELYDTVLSLSYTIDKNLSLSKDTTAILICDNTIDHILIFYAIQNLGIKLILLNNKVRKAEITKIASKQGKPCYIFSSGTGDSAMENVVDIDTIIAAIPKDKKEKFSTQAAKLVFPTSGTTGEPKLIEKRNGEIYWLHSFADLLIKTRIHQRKAVYVSIPISHSFGCTTVLFALVLGKKLLVTNTKDPQEIASAVIKEQTDLLVGVPSSLNKLAEIFRNIQHPFRSIISGAAPLNEIILKNITDVFGKNVFSIYGSTEASVSFIASYEHLQRHPTALGLPIRGVKYSLAALANGGHELLLQSVLSNITTGSGWLHTGDLVEKDSSGMLKWYGRKDTMIIKNAVNIYPEEIETQLLKSGIFEDVYVRGQKDVTKGEIIVATVKMKPGFVFDGEKIKGDLKQTLPVIKVPDKITEAIDFEYTSTGKKLERPDPMI
jgi:acyl-CoA synthetase (AMP-forming)/AMP-acid ligase II